LTFSRAVAKLRLNQPTVQQSTDHLSCLSWEKAMNPFELFQSSGIYKMAILYFSQSRGLAIVGRCASGDTVEVIQISGEVDPHTGNFTALDYSAGESRDEFPVITKRDFENLVMFIEAKIDNQTRMSIIEPELMRTVLSAPSSRESGEYVH
jgi:hypothetical protein